MPEQEVFQTAWASLARSLEELALEVDRAEEKVEEESKPIRLDADLYAGISPREDDEDDHFASYSPSFGHLSDEIAELIECVHEQNKERATELFDLLDEDWKLAASIESNAMARAADLALIDPLEDVWRDINSALEILRVSEPFLIFESKPSIIIPKLIVTVQQALIELVGRDPRRLFSISSREFEEIIAEIFASQGYDVELTQKTRDGGRDIIAIGSSMGIRNKYLIECKRYAPTNKVSIAAVQRLYGVKMSERANKAILATTSGFTRDAVQFARQHIWDVDLRGYDDIMKWINSYKY